MMERAESSRRDAPGEVTAPGSGKYRDFEHLTDLREPYRIAGTYLDGTKPELSPKTLHAPIIAFINARSGGKMGPSVAVELYKSLGDTQVFDLSQYRPDKVLTTLWANLKLFQDNGDKEATAVLQNLRIIAAGGDGTIAWIVKTIHDLKLDPAPAVAIMPLGTGNDLSRQLNWGPAFEKSWLTGFKNKRATLAKVADASVQYVDNWNLQVSIPDKGLFAGKPHSLVDEPEGREGIVLKGLFFNYVSVGLDAKSALGFHTVREAAPYLASNRIINQFWYAACSFKAGWFGCSRPLRTKCVLYVQRQPDSEWEELKLDSSMRAVVCLNLQNYGGGVNLWGTGLSKEEKEKEGYHEPWICDGMLEVVAFMDGYHTGIVMGTKGNLVHAKRIAQVCAVRMSLRSSLPHTPGEYSHAYIQVDGEPWTQPIPASANDPPVQLEVSYQGTSKMLYNGTISEEQVKKNKEGLDLIQQRHKMPVEVKVEPSYANGDADGDTNGDAKLHVPEESEHSSTDALRSA